MHVLYSSRQGHWAEFGLDLKLLFVLVLEHTPEPECTGSTGTTSRSKGPARSLG
jgi:hypothetical protein